VVWLRLAAATDPRRWLARTAVVVVWSRLFNVPRLPENAFPDLKWSNYPAKIRAGQAVDVPVNPEGGMMQLPAKSR